MTTDSKKAIVHEWEEWMAEFSRSKFQVLQDVSAKAHDVDNDAQSVIANLIVKNHKVNLLQESSEQVHHVSKELTDFMKIDMHRLFNLLMLYDQYSKEVLVKKAEYERRLRRSNKVILQPPSEEKECRDLEWDLPMLNSPAKQAGRRKSIVEQLKDDDDEDFVSNSPSNRKSIGLKSTHAEGSIALKFRSKPGKPKTLAERLKSMADDEEDDFAESDTC
ncbi:hypothetical protein CPB97_007495 [Podila verticillata]|nr:hypothetical protein CPB97_007495 [Podila verticillata]